MIKGIITTDINGEIADSFIDNCDILFVIRLIEVDRCINDTEHKYAIRTVMLGSENIGYTISAFAEAIMHQIKLMTENEPAETSAAMKLFQNCISGEVDRYMLQELHKSLERRGEEQDGYQENNHN